MLQPTVAFVTYGVHKDGLLDPLGKPFVDGEIVRGAREAFANAGVRLIEHSTVVATKAEALECMREYKHREDVDGVLLFRLISQVYEVDPLTCSRCGSPMQILAVITEPEEVHKILRHLVKIGRSPPGLDLASLN